MDVIYNYSRTSYTYNRLIVLKVYTKNNYEMCECKCTCGNIKTYYYRNVVKGFSKSCGCYKKEKLHGNKYGVKHGDRTRKSEYYGLYQSWKSMISRCYCKTNKNYNRYGERGITVYNKWRVYINFKKDMLDLWFKGATIDRIDNDKGYYPKNVRWCTRSFNSSKQDN